MCFVSKHALFKLLQTIFATNSIAKPHVKRLTNFKCLKSKNLEVFICKLNLLLLFQIQERYKFMNRSHAKTVLLQTFYLVLVLQALFFGARSTATHIFFFLHLRITV